MGRETEGGPGGLFSWKSFVEGPFSYQGALGHATSVTAPGAPQLSRGRSARPV